MAAKATNTALATTNTAVALKAPIASPVFTGNVGIGTSSPTHKQTIQDANQTSTQLKITSAAGNTAGAYGGIHIGGEASNAKAGIFLASNASGYSRGNLVFAVNNESNQNNASLTDARMTIDNAGRVTKPYQPSFRVGSVTYVTTGTTILHTIDFHDIGNNYNPANGRFTAPVAGVYYFGAQAISGSATTSAEQNIKFMKNGSAVCDARARSYTESSLHLKTVIELAVGDYMNVVVDSGSVYASGNGFHNQFMGYLIG